MSKTLHCLNPDEFPIIYSLMQKSFAPIEVRPYEMQVALLDNPYYKILVSLGDNKNIQGFIAEWSFEEFIFLEHFAVQPELRGAGIGKTMMQNYLQSVEKPVRIEVESDGSEISVRRINFYKRLGFNLSESGYYQPIMQRSPADKIYLKIMSYPTPINQESFSAIKGKIFREVYRITIN